MGEDIIKGNGVYPQTLNPYGYCWGNPINLVDFDGKSPWVLVPVVIALILGGCSSTEIQPVVEPKVETIPTPTPTPTPTPSPMPIVDSSDIILPDSTPMPKYSGLTEEEKLFVATVCGEAIGEGEQSRKMVAHVIMNRLESKYWSRYGSVTEIITKTGFDSYNSGSDTPFGKAMSYLNNRTYDNELYEKIICEVMPIYYGISEDFTGGATLFYSPKSMTPPYSLPDWNFEILNEIFIEGIDSNSFRMFIYKDECIE